MYVCKIYLWISIDFSSNSSNSAHILCLFIQPTHLSSNSKIHQVCKWFIHPFSFTKKYLESFSQQLVYINMFHAKTENFFFIINFSFLVNEKQNQSAIFVYQDFHIWDQYTTVYDSLNQHAFWKRYFFCNFSIFLHSDPTVC